VHGQSLYETITLLHYQNVHYKCIGGTSSSFKTLQRNDVQEWVTITSIFMLVQGPFFEEGKGTPQSIVEICEAYCFHLINVMFLIAT
jgi:hypothetical protein